MLLKAGNILAEAGRGEIPFKIARHIICCPDGEVVLWQILIKEAISGPGAPKRLRPRMSVALERHDWNLLRRHREVLRVVRVLLMKPEHGSHMQTVIRDRNRLRRLPVEDPIVRHVRERRLQRVLSIQGVGQSLSQHSCNCNKDLVLDPCQEEVTK